jgi:carbon-monoxide dehydrogenase small subunit
MTPVTLSINGRPVTRETAPRTHLADFIRDQVGLTGTHLGCEHGVCGACVVLVDGEPVRSCITFAVACEGRTVTTIEGHGDDPVMTRLRQAFTRHHALQCGYCTPGMLATARDIVLRLPQADERRIRAELSGNICRCTGYQGIVDAVASVLRELDTEPDPAVEALRDGRVQRRKQLLVDHTPSARAPAVSSPSPGAAGQPPETREAVSPMATSVPAGQAISDRSTSARSASASVGVPVASVAGQPGTTIADQFALDFPPDAVWALMSDPARVAACLPGAFISSQEGSRVVGGVALRFGPMQARFEGEAVLELDPSVRQACLRGRGRDRLTQSRAEGDIRWRVEASGSTSSLVSIEMDYSLQGPFAQFSRGGLVQEFVRRIVQQFAANMRQALQGPDSGPATGPSAPGSLSSPSATSAINPLGLVWQIIRMRLRRLFGLLD